jgi:hypothetical protein
LYVTAHAGFEPAVPFLMSSANVKTVRLD